MSISADIICKSKTITCIKWTKKCQTELTGSRNGGTTVQGVGSQSSGVVHFFQDCRASRCSPCHPRCGLRLYFGGEETISPSEFEEQPCQSDGISRKTRSLKGHLNTIRQNAFEQNTRTRNTRHTSLLIFRRSQIRIVPGLIVINSCSRWGFHSTPWTGSHEDGEEFGW